MPTPPRGHNPFSTLALHLSAALLLPPVKASHHGPLLPSSWSDCSFFLHNCPHLYPAGGLERLPLRVVVQVIFFEQVGQQCILISDLPNNVKVLLPQAESSSHKHNEDAIVAQNNGHTQEEVWDSVNNGFVAHIINGTNVNGKIVHAESTKGNMRHQEVFALN
ncbi:hypothetical protein GOP47_0025318 [Adiantum capillus-veneris]|uniref:Uncharacterized protein n=1 Tax=Adiantum capillus-veneris TaxID=13818 RepID=A0A9D4U091_ADICA|nr:hypothetical protein GOP47_0025318 [Adiantum capillus-veneris]